MLTQVSHVSVFVPDYDDALKYYTETLEMKFVADIPFGDNNRWVVVSPNGTESPGIVLAVADDDLTRSQVGKSRGIVFVSSDCKAFYEKFKAKGVAFHGEPEVLPWGTQAIFTDKYGNEFMAVELPNEQT